MNRQTLAVPQSSDGVLEAVITRLTMIQKSMNSTMECDDLIKLRDAAEVLNAHADLIESINAMLVSTTPPARNQGCCPSCCSRACRGNSR